MARYALIRLIQSLGVLVVVAFAAFVLLRFVGDPVGNMVGQDTTPEQREALRESLGLNDPAPVQFLRFLGGALQGDFGVSYRLQRPVSEVLVERAPATLELVFASALIAILLGIPLGLLTGAAPDHPVSRLVLGVSLIGVSLPTFVIGLLLIFVFSVSLGWLPSFGRDGLASLVLPAITLSLFQLTLILRLVRGEMMEVLRSDHIRFARARGLSARSIYLRHALKNALIPVITVIALNIGGLIGFSIVTETVFQWPGLGALFVQAIEFADVPVMAAAVFVTINFITDLTYRAIDPRLRGSS